MLAAWMGIDTGQYDIHRNKPREGDLFKVIAAYGKRFEIRYGFYEEKDRHTQYAEPVEIYPDFTKHPQYTEDGSPFVTEMQEPCGSFHGQKDENSGCGDCAYYTRCEELIGICSCPANQRARERMEVAI